MKKLIFTILSFNVLISFCQTVSYSDVAVIVNSNSTESIQIGNYFKSQRNIPDLNMIEINCSTNETIDSIEFENVRQQIETYLLANGLDTSINYLVTTKGVPLRVERSACNTMNCTSVDSELSLLLSPYSSYISSSLQLMNPYYSTNVHFSRQVYGIFLVSRLAGFTVQDAIQSIDKAKPKTPVNQSSTLHSFDLNYLDTYSSGLQYFQNFFSSAKNELDALNWNTHVDTLSSIFYSSSPLLSYFEYHENTFPLFDNHTWSDAGFVEIVNSFSASSFSNQTDEPLLAEFLQNGASLAHGYCYPTFFLNVMNHSVFSKSFYDTSKHFNFAESVFLSLPKLSDQSVVIGDPKASILIDNTASIMNISENTIRMYPNPATDYLLLNANEQIISISCLDIQGREIKRFNMFNDKLMIQDLPIGSYILKIQLASNQILHKQFIKK